MGTPSARVGVVLGVDIGSTNTKVAALDEDGRVVARARRATPRRAGPSVDAAELFDLVEELVLEVCGERFAVRAVCAAGVGEDGVLVDEALRPLTPALAWFAPQRTGVFRELQPHLAPAADLGTAADPARTLVGWAWARRREGAERAAAWLSLTDYASCRWSASPFLSDTLAARTAAWQTRGRRWVEERVRLTLGTRELLPPVVRTGLPVGPLRSERLGGAGVLADDAVVVAGGHDHPVGGWGVDRLSPGAILDSMGTAEVVVFQSPAPHPDVPDGTDTAAGIRSDGTTLLHVEELARNVQWASGDTAVGEAIQRIVSGELAPDEHLLTDAFLPGAAGGAEPAYAPGAPEAPASRASAVLGALAKRSGQAVQAIAEQAEQAGAGDLAVHTAGGWARSPGWIAVKQAVTGQPVTVLSEPEVTAVGAALLAAAACGWEADAARALAPASAPTASTGPTRHHRPGTRLLRR